MTKFKKGHIPWNKGKRVLNRKKNKPSKKELIINYLKQKGNYEKLDHDLIDRLLFKERLIKYLQKKIDDHIENKDKVADKDDASKLEREFRNNVELEKKTGNDIDSILKLLGLTPQERIKLKLVEPEEDDPLSDFD